MARGPETVVEVRLEAGADRRGMAVRRRPAAPNRHDAGDAKRPGDAGR